MKKTIESQEIGKRISLARKEAGGMTQRELADLLGVTERSIAAYEAGDVIPYRSMQRLESALGRPASWILYGEETAVPVEKTLKEILNRLTAIEEIIGERPVPSEQDLDDYLDRLIELASEARRGTSQARPRARRGGER